jgi:D-serine deaminase-like pyridoxal phosphate-dependent protein
VQKIGEAEVHVCNGVKDVAVSAQVIGERNLRLLAALPRMRPPQLASIPMTKSTPDSAWRRVPASCWVTHVDLEVGMYRCSVGPGRDMASLTRHVTDAPNLRFGDCRPTMAARRA